MNSWVVMIPVVLLLSCLLLAVSSRMLHLIRMVALQGVLLGILPLVISGSIEFSHWQAAAVNLAVKGVLLPYLLLRAMKKAQIQRELEPLVGYSFSAVVVLIFSGVGFWIATQLPGLPQQGTLIAAAAFTALLTGLFIVAARKKALTQVIGFLIFENGITLFGLGLMRHHSMIVELGILLDVFVLVFIMGITVCQINREFSHIDADKLRSLGDADENQEEKA